jgi:hypothetical protein
MAPILGTVRVQLVLSECRADSLNLDHLFAFLVEVPLTIVQPSAIISAHLLRR